LYRTDGNTTKNKITDDHYKFVAKNYFQDRNFETEFLFKAWIKDYSPEINKSVFKAVVDCSSDKATSKSMYFKAPDFSSPILPGMLNCVSATAKEISDEYKAKISLNEPDGCLAMTDYTHKGKWDTQIKAH